MLEQSELVLLMLMLLIVKSFISLLILANMGDILEKVKRLEKYVYRDSSES